MIFLRMFHFLLIDEPTNHLDQEAREIVKQYLASKKGFILVSHDRDLLDACTDHCLVLNRKSIEVQSGNFSGWWENKQRKDRFVMAENEKHQKEIRKLKSKLMDEIVQMMDEIGEGEPDTKTQKKLDENKRLINECNEKVDTYQDELLDLPREIDKVNKELMIRTMELCYDDIASNTKDIKEIAEWITKVRIELKKQVLRKQDRETRNQELYHYLHGIFGADVIDIFDMNYHPEAAENHEKTIKSGNQKQTVEDRKKSETVPKKENKT